MPDARVSILIEAQDKANAALDRLEANLKDVGKTGQQTGVSLGKIAGGTLLGNVGFQLADGFLGAAKSAVGFNIQLEQAQMTYETLLGTATDANNRIAELKKFAAVTPFRFEDVMKADRLLQTFGARSVETLTLVGDAAAGTGQNFSEVAFWIGRAYSAIKAGQPFGEAAMRLQEMGILTAEGRKEIDGLTDSGAKWNALQKELAKYTGLMEKQSATLGGQLSTLQDEFLMLTSDITSGLIPAMTDLIGVANDFVTVAGLISDNLGGPLGDALGFVKDGFDAIPMPIKVMGAAATAATFPLLGITGAIVKGVDALSDLGDEAEGTGNLLASMGRLIGQARTQSDGFNRSVSESNSSLWQTPQAAMAVRDSLIGVEEKWRAAKDAADKARTAFFDALNVPSPERRQRELALTQAEFNVGRLEQQDASGTLTPERKKWLDWLKNDFIPAQKEWLKLDELRIDRDEKAAILADETTGDYRQMGRAIRGELTPNLKDLNSGLYDTKDAMKGLQNVTPQDLKVNLTKPNVPAEVKAIRAEVRGEGTIPINTSWNKPPKSPNQIITELKADATENVKVGMEWTAGFPRRGPDGSKQSPNKVITDLQGKTTENVKVGMEWRSPDTPDDPTDKKANGKSPNQVILDLQHDATENVKVGMAWQNPETPTDPTDGKKPKSPNQVITDLGTDTTENVKVGMAWRNPETPADPTNGGSWKSPNRVIIDLQGDTTETVKPAMSWQNPSAPYDPRTWTQKTPAQIIADLNSSAGGPQGASVKVPLVWIRPDNRGMTPGDTTLPLSGGNVIINVTLGYGGPTLATEAEMQRAARLLVPALRRELDRVYA